MDIFYFLQKYPPKKETTPTILDICWDTIFVFHVLNEGASSILLDCCTRDNNNYGR